MTQQQADLIIRELARIADALERLAELVDLRTRSTVTAKQHRPR